MHRLIRFTEQLQLAGAFLHEQGQQYARLALILCDNVVELLAHEQCEMYLLKEAKGWSITKFSNAERADARGQEFAPKINLLVKLKDVTEEQRDFVRRALATTDIALLQGPPGSGKTTAICELVLQAIKRGERVLMCATTHVAIDNALEKLYDKRPEMLEAVRIGIEDRVDEKVRELQLDNRKKAILATWDKHQLFHDLSTEDREDAALTARARHEAVARATAPASTRRRSMGRPVIGRCVPSPTGRTRRAHRARPRRGSLRLARDR